MIVIAENIETTTPIARTRANPLIVPVPKLYRIKLVISVETFESRIEVQALENPNSTDTFLLFPFLISSRVLSKIKIFASTAIPIERINPAIPAKVSVIP